MGWREPQLLILLAGVASGASCSRVTVDLEDRVCDTGVCVDGYVCSPFSSTCVTRVAIDCATANGICPAGVGHGDTCAPLGAILPCDDDADCARGCRECRAAGWSACYRGDCLTDRDDDGAADCADNCPDLHNPGQADMDGDNLGDTCDPLPEVRGFALARGGIVPLGGYGSADARTLRGAGTNAPNGGMSSATYHLAGRVVPLR